LPRRRGAAFHGHARPGLGSGRGEKTLQDAAEKIKEKHERIQTKARLSVEASLGAQADCREYADELEGRRVEQLLAARLSLDIYKQGEGKPQAGAVTRDGKK
jgi:hypothetical protein